MASLRQWQAIDDLSTRLANGTLKCTTRQTIQFHGVLKASLRPLLQECWRVCLDSIAACGDVNRNVMCNPNPYQSGVHEQVLKARVLARFVPFLCLSPLSILTCLYFFFFFFLPFGTGEVFSSVLNLVVC